MQNQFEANIKEIFSSIQGEGIYVGCKHLFIRFCLCNLKCNYCDTDFSNKNSKKYSQDELYNKIKDDNSNFISFTGGEPLLHCDFLYDFLKKYKSKLNKKIYLETNGTLYKELEKIIDYTDIIASDIKLKSATGQENRFDDNSKFIKIASKKELFVKVVFNSKITEEEILYCSNITKQYSIPLILQPQMPIEKNLNIENIFEKFYKINSNTRLIAQTHKFLDLK